MEANEEADAYGKQGEEKGNIENPKIKLSSLIIDHLSFLCLSKVVDVLETGH